MNVPNYGTKSYDKIVRKGCGSYQIGSPTGGFDTDCAHGYNWSCDDCPCVTYQYYSKNSLQNNC